MKENTPHVLVNYTVYETFFFFTFSYISNTVTMWGKYCYLHLSDEEIETFPNNSQYGKWHQSTST